jgi:hypothetical protein
MAEPLPEPTPPAIILPARDPELEVARKNIAWGWALFALFWVLFGGTIGVAFIYLWLD